MKIVLCNCPPDDAPRIGRVLVQRKLAACVNALPGVRSFYEWKGEICDDPETTLLIKVTADGMPALREALVELHPYEVPEILALDVNVGDSHRPYVDWVGEVIG